MYLRVDTGTTPPLVEVVEPDDFTSFKVVVVTPAHSWVQPGQLAALAGRDDDPDWQQKLAGMVSYAESKGWVDEQGRIRAHVQTQDG
ncbi:hypothetical protein AB4Z39_05655 [Mycobacterium adipatum]|jgi:hypothetical protein|uniref:hypothetical protein n=1 Tax=Mycobacterium adipatum TaxID=1682113 RepID=UPI0034E08166